MAYVTSADIQSRLSSQDFLRVFDRNGDGFVDGTFLSTCLSEAQSEVDMRLGAAFPMPLDANGALIDERVKGATVAIALYVAVRYNPLGSGDLASPYRQAYQDALEFLDRLRMDNGERLKTAAGGRAAPRGVNANLLTDAGDYTNPFGRAADQRDGSGY